MKNIVILTGAGMSAESGIQTFRGNNGLWEGHDIMEVASPIGWQKNQALVLDFYNQRRRQLLEVEPNLGHRALVDLENHYNVDIITQNVDDLHERAGSKNVTHLHGELFKVCSTGNPSDVKEWKKDLKKGDCCEAGHQLRPHIVWFGEAVPMMDKAMEITAKADILLIIGTSMVVYPAAGLMDLVKENTPIYFIDPSPQVKANENLTIIAEKATQGVPKIVDQLINKA